MTYLRKTSSTRSGGAFDDWTIQQVWEKGQPAPGRDPNVWRLDRCGALMRRDLYGDTTPKGFGWEIDHIMPVAHGGKDDLGNLQPLQWENNRGKGDNYPNWTCSVKAA
jgi:hypothetical protein